MSCVNPSPFILQELPDITEHINYPLKTAQRIRYTCFDVSQSMLAFGATSGGIYVFSRSPCEFIQLIPNKDGPITRLAISSDENHISFANGKGIITVTECDQSCRHSASSKEHQGNEVTAMVWGNNMLFTGDDVGKVSVLQLHSFIAKTIFQSSSHTIMSLDSRICQLDVKGCMLLVSTLTRCYICDTSQEQYRQIGQKLRDGEFGACFVNKEKGLENIVPNAVKNITEAKQYNIVDGETAFAVSKELENTLIYCARPSSRLWEASIDGTVRRTHQFKQILSKPPIKLISVDSYSNENIPTENDDFIEFSESDGQSTNFPKIMSLNSAIFSFKRDALYFLNVKNVDDTLWFDKYKDIMECKVYHDTIYVWLASGSLLNLKFMKIEKFLVKCYVDEKYVMCAELCALYSEYLLSNLSAKLFILTGLRDKIASNGLLTKIGSVLDKLDSMKTNEATQLKPGIHVVDNAYNAQTSLLHDDNLKQDDSKFNTPEALQAIKDLGVSVSDKFSNSKKILKGKWENFEEKMKHLGEKQQIQEVILPKRVSHEQLQREYIPVVFDDDIIYKESSQKAIDIDNNSLENDKTCKNLYQYYRLSLVKETERSNLLSIIENYACDIRKIYELMLLLEQYILSIDAIEESKFVPNNIFLLYIDATSKKDEILDIIIKDEILYKYFVDSCISVNMTSQKLSNLGCECGYPLPYTRTNQIPVFSELIDDFIERQWSSCTRDLCYEMCKRMPYLWRKILYLRRNEDLLNILRLLLQMLDENLLHSFLPQFTLDTWDSAVKLYSTLHANICLNCNKKFDNISVKDMLSWDDLGAIIIKSVGSKNAVKLLSKHADLIDAGEITMKFYHSCLLTCIYEKYDVTIASQLTDTIYSCYESEDARKEICQLLLNSNGKIKNTALPIIIAANSRYWGLNNEVKHLTFKRNNLKLTDIIDNITEITNGVADCTLCGLPLQNEVLIQDAGLWVFKCGHTFHGACLDLNEVKLCPSCLSQ